MDQVIDYFNHTWGYVELAGTVASLICVYLAVTQNIWTWFWGAIGVVIFGPLFYHYQLYSDAGLQILFFLPMQVLGWYIWKYKGSEGIDSLNVKCLSDNSYILIVATMFVVSGILGHIMSSYTDASFPYADALTTVMSIFAQILMLRKFVESWHIWVAMDAIAIYIYSAKELYVVSGLYALFFVLASMGWVAWHRSYKEQEI